MGESLIVSVLGGKTGANLHGILRMLWSFAINLGGKVGGEKIPREICVVTRPSIQEWRHCKSKIRKCAMT